MHAIFGFYIPGTDSFGGLIRKRSPKYAHAGPIYWDLLWRLFVGAAGGNEFPRIT